MRALALLATCLLTLSSLYAKEPANELESEWVITGTVVEESGTPLEGGRRIVVPKRFLPGIEGQEDSGDETTARWTRPVEGATVRWIGRMDTTATTDASGNFRLPLGRPVPDRDRQWVELWVTKPGEAPLAAYVVHRPDAKSPQPARIHLKPAKELTVAVVDENGNPVEGADVAFMPRDVSVVHGKTNAEGVWTSMIPANDPRGTIIARKSGIGFDYAQAERGKDNKSPPSIPDNVRLVLGGARTLRIKVIDMQGNPIPGISVSPSAISEISEDPEYSTVNFWNDSRFATTTNKDGIATFDWLPTEFKNSITLIDKSDDFYPYRRAIIRPGDGVEQLTLRLCPYESISGRVVHADGSPASEITVIAHGRGEADLLGAGRTATDAEGRYEIKLGAEQAYYLKIKDEKWTAPCSWPHVLRIGKPLANVDLTLVAPSRLHGQVTAGADLAPVANMRMSVEILLGEVPQEIQDLPPEESRRSFEVTDTLWTHTDENGNYDFMLAPGDYLIHPPGGSDDLEPVPITISAEDPPAELRKDLHRGQRRTGPLTITVVDQNGDPIPHATLLSQYRADIDFRPATGGFWSWFEPTATNGIQAVTTGPEGKHTTQRVFEKLVLYAASPDQSLQGISRVDAKGAEAEIVVGPTTSASGTLLDSSTGENAVNKRLEYGIRVYIGLDENSGFFTRFGGETTTDDEGRFTIEGLIPGEEYMVTFPISPSSSRNVTTITVPTADPLDLGDVKVNPQPYQPYVPPTPAERAANYFDASPDTKIAERLASVLGSARRMYTRPLVLVGRSDDPAAIELFHLFYDDEQAQSDKEEEDQQSPRDLRWEYELIALSLDRDEVAQYAQQNDISIGENAPPMLLALDEQGEIIDRLSLNFERNPVMAPKPEESIEEVPTEQGGAQPFENAVTQFLLEHKLPTRDAEAMLDEAFATAAARDKKVFLICSASWCGPCRMLAKFLDPHHEALEKHYVFVKLDVSRDTHAREINTRYKGERSGGVPWYVILDSEGKELISSNMPAEIDGQQVEEDGGPAEEESDYPTNGQNMGHPGSPEGADHFLNMLTKTAPQIDPELLEKMRKELEEN